MNPSYQRALILHAQGRYSDAERELRQSLATEPNDPGAHAMLDLWLAQRDDYKAATAEAHVAIGLSPEDADSHANQGWTLLHASEPRRAMEHFREALRLEPNHQWARAGIVEALKARVFLYRWLLAYFLWMARLSGRAQWGILL